jgi:hypothetical protein
MVFLDNLITDSSLLLRAMKTILYCTVVLKTITKKFAKQENLSLFMYSILKNGKTSVENYTKLKSEKTQVDVQKPKVKMLYKNSISE